MVERSDLAGRPDFEIAHWARDQDRVVVTENVVDFVSLDASDRGGLLLLNARRWPRTAGGLGRIGAALQDWITRPRDPATFSVDWL